MDTEKVKRVVSHSKLYLAVKGKLEHVPKGTELTITMEQAKKLGSKLIDPGEVNSVEIGPDPDIDPDADLRAAMGSS